MEKTVDYIIVGLGLAGIAFAEELNNAGKSFVVFENNSQVSSLVAGGVYNPVILKRFTPAWNGHEQLQFARPFYKAIEKKLNITIDTSFTTKKMFTSIGDENNWFTSLDRPNLSHYMQTKIEKNKIKGVRGEHGFGILKGTGRIDIKKLIEAYKEYLRSNNKLIETTFDYDELTIDEIGISYDNIKASKVLFCEGYGLKENPYFKYLPLNGTKGEVMTIHAPDLNIDFLLKGAVFTLPLGDNYYKIGATFNWTDKTSIPTEEGKQELSEKLNKIIDVPFTVIDQHAGIRPTVKDRRPLVGKHPKHKQLAVLNGLGTRGVMIAPTVAKNLYNHLENDEALDDEITIERFEEMYGDS